MTRVSRRKTLSHSELENFLNEIDVASDPPQQSSALEKPVATFEHHSHLVQSPPLTSPAPTATVDPLRAEVQSIRQFCRATFATYRSGIPLEPTRELCDVGREILAGSSYPILSRRLLCPNDYLYPSSTIEGKKALLMSLSPMLSEADEQRKKETSACENFTRCKSSKGKGKFSSYDYTDIDVKCQVDFAEYEKRYLLYIAHNKKTYARESPLSPSLNYITLQHRQRTHRARSNSTTSNGSTTSGGFPRRNLQQSLNSAATRSSPAIQTGVKTATSGPVRADTENTAPYPPVPPAPTMACNAPQLRSPVAVPKPPAAAHLTSKHRIEPQPVKLDDSTMELLAALRKPKQPVSQAPTQTPCMQQPFLLSPPSKMHAQQPAQVLWAPQPPPQPAPSLHFQSPRSQRSPPSAPKSPTSVPPSPVSEPLRLVTQTTASALSPAAAEVHDAVMGNEDCSEAVSDVLSDPHDGGRMELEDSIIERLRRGRSSSERKRKHGRGTSQSPRSSAEGSLGSAAGGASSDTISSGKQAPRQQARRGTLSPGAMRAMLLEACTNPSEEQETEEVGDISLVDEDDEPVALGDRRGQARRGTLSPASVRAMLLAACVGEEGRGGMAVESEDTTEVVVAEERVRGSMTPAAHSSARTPPASGTKSATGSSAAASPVEHLHRLECAVPSAEADLLGLNESGSAQKDRVKKLARSGSPVAMPTSAHDYDTVVHTSASPEQISDQEQAEFQEGAEWCETDAMAVEQAGNEDDATTMADAPSGDCIGDNDDDGACIDFAAEMIVFSGGRASYAPSRRRSSILPSDVHVWDLPTASRTPSPVKAAANCNRADSFSDLMVATTGTVEAACDQAEEVPNATELAEVGVPVEDLLQLEQSEETNPAEQPVCEATREWALTGAEQEAVDSFGRELDDILCDVSTLGAPLSPYASSRSGCSGGSSDDGEDMLCFSPYVPPPATASGSQAQSQVLSQTPSQQMLSPQQLAVWAALSPPPAAGVKKMQQSSPMPGVGSALTPAASRQPSPPQTPSYKDVSVDVISAAVASHHEQNGASSLSSPQCHSVTAEVESSVDSAITVSMVTEVPAAVLALEVEHTRRSPVAVAVEKVASPELGLAYEAPETGMEDEGSHVGVATPVEAVNRTHDGTEAAWETASPVTSDNVLGEQDHQHHCQAVEYVALESVPDCEGHASAAMAVEGELPEDSLAVGCGDERVEISETELSTVSAVSSAPVVPGSDGLSEGAHHCDQHGSEEAVLATCLNDSGIDLSEEGEDANNTSMDDSVLLFAGEDPELDDFQMLESLVEQEYRSGELQSWDFGGLGGLSGKAMIGGVEASGVDNVQCTVGSPSSPTKQAFKPAFSPVQDAATVLPAISSTPAPALSSPLFAHAVSTPGDRPSALSGRRHSGIPRYATSPASPTAGGVGVGKNAASVTSLSSSANRVNNSVDVNEQSMSQDPLRMSIDGATVEVCAATNALLGKDSAEPMEIPEAVDLVQAAARAQARYEERVAVARWKQLWEVVSAHAVNAAIARLRRQT